MNASHRSSWTRASCSDWIIKFKSWRFCAESRVRKHPLYAPSSAWQALWPDDSPILLIEFWLLIVNNKKKVWKNPSKLKGRPVPSQEEEETQPYQQVRLDPAGLGQRRLRSHRRLRDTTTQTFTGMKPNIVSRNVSGTASFRSRLLMFLSSTEYENFHNVLRSAHRSSWT